MAAANLRSVSRHCGTTRSALSLAVCSVKGITTAKKSCILPLGTERRWAAALARLKSQTVGKAYKIGKINQPIQCEALTVRCGFKTGFFRRKPLQFWLFSRPPAKKEMKNIPFSIVLIFNDLRVQWLLNEWMIGYLAPVLLLHIERAERV